MSQEWKEPAAGDDVQMPLGTGGDAAPARTIRRPGTREYEHAAALLAAFAAALIVLYFLGLAEQAADRHGRGPGARPWRPTARLRNGSATRRARRGSSSLATGFSRGCRISLGAKIAAMELPGNPFEHQSAKVPRTHRYGPGPGDPLRTLRIRLLKEVAREFAGLKRANGDAGQPARGDDQQPDGRRSGRNSGI